MREGPQKIIQELSSVVICEAAMAANSRNALFIFYVFTHLIVLYTAEEVRNRTECPAVFCNEIVGNIYFPFKSIKHGPECGLYTVDCSNSSRPKIQLKEGGYWYQFESITRSSSIFINDSSLQERLERDVCDDQVFDELSLPISSPIINVSTTNNLTLFRCNNTQLDKTPPNCACRSSRFTYCTTPNDSLASSTLNDSLACSIIQIPRRQDSPPNVYSPSALTAEFSLQVQVTEECNECYTIEKGECRDDEGEFKCAYAQKGPRSSIFRVSTAFAVSGIGVVLFFGYWLLVFVSSLYGFSKEQIHNCQIVEDYLRIHGPLQVRRYSYLDVKEMTNSFKEKLGQGGYGGVYKGKLNDGSLVAVKVLNRSKDNGEEFLNEVVAISRTSHVNIVNLLGYCFDSFEGSERALIYEFMPNGSLEKFIFDANTPPIKDCHLGWEALYQISLGIARGLEYLHRGCNTRILHFDIKPHNILLDESFSPKISDFGLAKICDKKETIVSMLGARGTAGYIAPEVFCRNFGGVSHKSDVYSYGMMLSEMVGGRRNINVEAENTSEIYFPHWIYKRLELNEELGLQSMTCQDDKARARKMIIVSLWCIQTDPSNRPAMREVIEMLEGSVDSLQMPPNPYLSSPPKAPAVAANSSTTLVSIRSLYYV